MGLEIVPASVEETTDRTIYDLILYLLQFNEKNDNDLLFNLIHALAKETIYRTINYIS